MSKTLHFTIKQYWKFEFEIFKGIYLHFINLNEKSLNVLNQIFFCPSGYNTLNIHNQFFL